MLSGTPYRSLPFAGAACGARVTEAAALAGRAVCGAGAGARAVDELPKSEAVVAGVTGAVCAAGAWVLAMDATDAVCGLATEMAGAAVVAA
eukprot:7291716-Prymnesium_polylepis.1